MAICGNYSVLVERAIGRLGLPVDALLSSGSLESQKPSPQFFKKLVQRMDRPASEIAYISDRVDNDVLPAREAGMTAIFLRRGPWGYLQASSPEAAAADIHLDSLEALPGALAQFERQAHRG